MKIEEIGSYVEYSLNKNIIDCFKHSNLNKVPQRQQISLSLSLWNDDQEDSILQKVCELVTSQLVDSLIRTISKDIFTTESISFINFSKNYRGKSLSNQQMISEIF
jgi:hypothetical protein